MRKITPPIFAKVCQYALMCSTALATSNAFAGFIDDSSLDLTLRNVYFNKDIKGDRGQKNTKERQWVQGVQLDYKSGYFADILGFDASYFGAFKLDDGDNEKADLLPIGSDGHLNDISTLGVANIKARFGDKNLGANFRAGRMMLNTPLLASSTRALPGSYNAVYGDGHWDHLKAYALQTNQVSNRDQSAFTHWKAGDENIDNVRIYGLKYQMPKWYVQADSGRSDDYIKRRHYSTGYTFDLPNQANLAVDAHYNTAKHDGDLYQQANGFAIDARMLELDLIYTQGPMQAALSYKQNRGDTMRYYWSSGEPKEGNTLGTDHGTIPGLMDRQVSEFWAYGEDVYQGALSYDFSEMGLQGFSSSITYTYGRNGHNPHDIDKGSDPALAGQNGNEWERDIVFTYAFQNPSLKGLSLSWQTATYRNSNGSNVDFGQNNENDNRVYLDYTLSLL